MEIAGQAKANEISSENHLSEVLRDVLISAVIAVDERHQVTTYSPEAETLTRLPAQKALNRTLDVLPTPIRALFKETFATGQPITSKHLTLAITGNRTQAVRASTCTILDKNGKVTSVMAVLNDLSAAARLEQRMQRLDRLASIGTLSASMAHEIKNALVPIRTFVDLLLEQNKDAELAELVGREMRRVESLVSQMLRFAGPAKPTFGPINVHEVLERALQLVEHQLAGRKLRVQKSFHSTAATVQGDAYQLEQAFLNLFFNAMEAMGPNGCLTVATADHPEAHLALKETGAAADPVVRIAISDTGVGVPAEDRARMFEPFFTTKPNGTGLGLTITRRIIAEHQGSIEVASGSNRGTTFNIHFPLAAVPNAPASEPAFVG